MHHVPLFASDPARAALEKLDEMTKEAMLIVQGRKTTLSYDMVAFEAAYVAAVEANALLQKMLETARKHT